MRGTFNLHNAQLPIAEFAVCVVVAIGQSIGIYDSVGKLLINEMVPALVDVTRVTRKLHPVAFNAIPVHFIYPT